MKYLLDTNVLIYYFNGLPLEDVLQEVLMHSFQISIITKIEFLGWSQFVRDASLSAQARAFVNYAHVHPLDHPVAEATIALRQRHRIKVPDAIIAATALVHGLTVVTQNMKDFNDLGVQLLPIRLRA